jgi:hypothetical protein
VQLELKGKGTVMTGAASGADSGGGEHCQCGNTSLVHAAVFDWLLQTFRVV